MLTPLPCESQYSIGHAISAGSFPILHLLKQPLYFAIATSLLALGFGKNAPEWIANTTDLIGGLVIPALLMVLGHSLAQLKISDFKRSIQLAFVRLTIGISLGFLLVFGLQLEGAKAGVVFLMSKCLSPCSTLYLQNTLMVLQKK